LIKSIEVSLSSKAHNVTHFVTLPYVDALIHLAEDIRKGAGSRTLEQKVSETVNGKDNMIEFERKVVLPSGQVIAQWTKGGLNFSKDIPLNQEAFEKMVIQYFTGAGI